MSEYRRYGVLPYPRNNATMTLVIECPGAATNSPGRAHHLARGGEMAKRICSIEGCERRHFCRGWCRMHHARWLRHGDPLRKIRPAIERFVESYEVVGGGCWQWVGRTNVQGYGQFSDGRDQKAHRWSYEHLVGPIPEGLEIDHLCRNTSCVNPEHLEPVTRLENMRRSLPYRAWRTATHCKNGHEFTPDNTYEMPSRGRVVQVCRTCRRASDSRRRAKRASL